MSGGSIQPETQQDQQCTHCLLYYSSRGIHNHEDTCIFADVDLDQYAAHVRAERQGDEVDTEHGGDAVESASDDANSGDGEVAETTVSDAADANAQAARTDGAGLGLSGPPESADTDDATDADSDDELQCLDCGDSLGVTDDDLREEYGTGPVRLTCECGKGMRWTA